jgi:hypothetical protein
MTIHAAKGLEFESVFLVNMHQRRREDTSLPRIRELPDGEIEVTALGSAPGGGGAAAEPNRVEEEEKRLLYVALTRARRRLALSAVAAEGNDPEKSLLGLLPRSFREKLAEALDAETPELEWRGHSLRVLKPAEGRRFEARAPERRDRLRLEPLSFDAFELRGERSAPAEAPAESVPVPEELLDGEVHRDVPYTLARGRSFVRGEIDVLVIRPDGVTVVERRPERRHSMDDALDAVAALSPGRSVRGVFLAPGAPPVWVNRAGGGEQTQIPLFEA